MSLGVCVSVCVSAALRIVSARRDAGACPLVSAAKVMHCIQCFLVTVCKIYTVSAGPFL